MLKGVTFDRGSAQLTPDSRAILDQVVGKLRNNPGLQIEVAGHTDSTGKAADNARLSQQRAEAVKRYMVGAGIDRDGVSARGYGQERPVADNDTDEGRAENRRVELQIR